MPGGSDPLMKLLPGYLATKKQELPGKSFVCATPLIAKPPNQQTAEVGGSRAGSLGALAASANLMHTPSSTLKSRSRF